MAPTTYKDGVQHRLYQERPGLLICLDSIDPSRPKRQAWCFWFVGLVLLAGCGSLPAPTPVSHTAAVPTPITWPEAADVAIPELILRERNAAAARDLPLLSQLWAADGRIVDQRNTADPHDDYIWPGRAAVLDRYQVAVFPNPPPPLAQLDDLTIDVQGDQATASHGQDRWRFVRQNGRWWIAELVYAPPPA
jgi:hypothetical protein